jgi:hypothetical protein
LCEHRENHAYQLVRRREYGFVERLSLTPFFSEVGPEGSVMLDNAGVINKITRLRCRVPRFDILLAPSNLPD